MKKVLIALLVLIAVAVAGLLVAPSLVDWNAQKPRIAAEVRKAIGRDIEIAGDVSLSLIPTPALSVHGLRVANIEGGSAPYIVALEAADLRVAFWPLLRGVLQVRSLVLVEPRILLEVLPDGRQNWQIAVAGAADSAAGTRGSGPEPQARPRERDDLSISLDRVMIRDGILVYRDAAAEREERLERLDAEIQAHTLSGPFEVTGEARLRGRPLKFDATLGSVSEGAASRLRMSLRLPESGNTTLSFRGDVDLLASPLTLNGRIESSAENAAALAAAFAPDTPWPAQMAQPLSLSADVRYDGAALAADTLAFALGTTEAAGEATLTLGEPLQLAGALGVPRLDLDALLAESGGGGGGQGVAASHPFALPEGIVGTLRLEVDTLIYREQVVRQALASLRLERGQVEVEQALALLPGGADVTVSGTLSAEAGAPRFRGRVEAAADNLRGLLAWLGVDVEGVPGARLRRMDVAAAVDASPAEARFTGIDLGLDTSRVTGGVALALGPRPAFGAGLSIDRLDLDAYFPVAAGGGGGQGTSAEAADDAAADDVVAGVAQLLDTFDANLDLRVGRLTYRGRDLGDLRFDGTLQAGVLTLRDLLIGDFAEGTLRLSGVFHDLAGPTPRVDDGRLSISVPEPARLARLLDLDAESPLSRLEGLQLDSRLAGSLAAFTFDGNLVALGGEIAAAGSISGLPTSLTLGDGRVEARGVSGPRLAAVAGLPADSPVARLGTLGLDGRLSGDLDAVQVDGTLRALEGVFSARGQIAAPTGEAPSFDLTIGGEHPDAAALTRGLLGDSAVNPGAGALTLTGKLTGTPAQFSLADLDGRIGPTVLRGMLALDSTGARPKLTAQLSGGDLPLDLFVGSGGGGGAGVPDARWSRQPFDSAPLRALDAEAALDFQSVSYGALRLDDAKLDLGLADGRADIRSLTGRLYDGALSVKGAVLAKPAGDGLEAGLSINVVEAELGRLLREQADFGRVSGPVSLTASLTAAGDSEAALVSSLAGDGRVEGTLTAEARAEDQVGGLLLGLLGQKVGEVRGLSDALGTIMTAFSGTPAALDGTFVVTDGVVTTRDLSLTGRGAVARAAGTLADLPGWRMDLETKVFRQQESEPYVSIALAGPLDRPNPRLSGRALSKPATDGPASLPGAIQDLLKAPAAPADGGEKRERKEKAIQDIIRGLTGQGD